MRDVRELHDWRCWRCDRLLGKIDLQGNSAIQVKCRCGAFNTAGVIESNELLPVVKERANVI